MLVLYLNCSSTDYETRMFITVVDVIVIGKRHASIVSELFQYDTSVHYSS